MTWIKRDGKVVMPGIIMMLVMGSVYSYSVFRLSIESFYQVNTSLSGLPYMTSLLFYALFMGISGKLLEKISQYRVMIIGIVMITFGWIIAYFSTSFIVLVVGYGVFIGTGIGLIYGIPLAIITTYYSAHKGTYLGLVLVGFGLSPFITAPLMQQLIEEYSLHTTFLVMGLLSFAILLTLSLFYKSYEITRKEHSQKSLITTVKSRSFIILYMLFFIATLIGLSVIGFSSTVASKGYRFEAEQAAFLVSLFAVFNGLGRVLYGGLADRFNIRAVMNGSFISLLISIGGLVLFKDSRFVFVVAFSIIWLNLGGWLAIAPNATSTLFGKDDYARNYGVLFSGYGLGALLGGYLTGYIIETYGYDRVFLVLLLCALLGLILNQFLIKKNHKG
jgi:MFS family permease